MPSNEQRRAAAKRKLERRLARQAERARKRRRLGIIGSVIAVIVVVGAGFGIYYSTHSTTSKAASPAPRSSEASLSNTPPPGAPLPAVTPKAATVDCSYHDGDSPAAKPVQRPEKTQVSTQENPKVQLDTSQGPIGISLNAAAAPCTVNSFVSLASQGFFNGTPCHRLTTTPGLKVLQCGDPSGNGTGGPGYAFDNEYPTDQFNPGDAASQTPVQYQRGVVAMANAGPNTNGSQFFLVYGDSQLPPQYTIFGTIDAPGLTTLDKVAAAGSDGGGDGKPKLPVTLTDVHVS